MAVTINGTSGMTTPTGVFSDSSGNVGIGTTSPSIPLYISLGGAYKATFKRTDGTNAYVTFEGTSTTGNNGIGTSGDNVSIITGGTERMVVNSSGVITGTAGNLMLVSGTSVSASGTSVDFTGIPSWVKRVTVIFSGISATSSDEYLIQIGNGSFLTSGYASACSGSSTSAGATNGFIVTVSNAASATFSGSVCLTSTGSQWTSNGNLQGASNTIRSSAGGITLSTLDRVRITSLAGAQSFDAGTFNILYE